MHLVIASLARPVKCQECHTVPQSAFTPSHPVGLPASVVFQDTLARLASGDGSFVPSPQYDAADGKCNNTYCHGNWRLRKATSAYPDPGVWSDSVMTGANFSPVWNGGGAQATCATCHSSASGGTTYPVPAGHAPATLANCSFCHTGVVDATGKIIDKTKHMNGKANVFGTERRM
jgi:predicted CxxxxCH...CXXCH cytochrome family protein